MKERNREINALDEEDNPEELFEITVNICVAIK